MEIESQGAALHLRVEGAAEDPAVVFLHGVQSSGDTYDWLPEEVRRGRRTYTLDHRGHGASGRRPGTYTFRDYFADAAAVLETVVQRPAVIVGHSLGGVLGWALAQERPDLVRGVLAEDPPLYFGDDEVFRAAGMPDAVDAIRRITADWRADGFDDEAAAAAFAEMESAGPGTPPGRSVLTEDEIRAQSHAFLVVDPEVQDRAYDNGLFSGFDPALSINGVPILIIAAGEQAGSVFPAEHQRWLADAHAGVEVVRLGAATHSVKGTRETRGAYMRTLVAFLDEHAPGTALPA